MAIKILLYSIKFGHRAIWSFFNMSKLGFSTVQDYSNGLICLYRQTELSSTQCDVELFYTMKEECRNSVFYEFHNF